MIPLFLALTAASAVAPSNNTKFQDWWVACDNILHCRAATGTTADNQDTGRVFPNETIISIERDGDPQSAATIEIEQVGRRAYYLSWDNGRNKLPLMNTVNYDTALKNPSLLLQPETHAVRKGDVAKIISALRTHNNFRLLDGKGSPVGTISLAGANAALLWVDDRQHRIGTTTALIRSGSRPTSLIPNPPPLPVVHAARPSLAKPLIPAIGVQRQLAATSSCDEKAHTSDIEFDRLDAQHTLALLVCPDTGYNRWGDISVIDDRSPARPWTPKIPSNDSLNWDWNSKTHSLSTGLNSHGSLDCSTEDVFIWSGHEFLTKERSVICSGGGVLYTYRTRVVYDR